MWAACVLIRQINEKRIAAVYRGAGPVGSALNAVAGFDAFLLSMATQKGARLVPRRVEEVSRSGAGMLVRTHGNSPEEYDLLAVATGVNTNALRQFPPLEPGYRPPTSVRSMVREYRLGAEAVEEYLGSSFHVFLLDLPGLDFAGIIPKGDYATVCFLGSRYLRRSIYHFLEQSPGPAVYAPGVGAGTIRLPLRAPNADWRCNPTFR